MRDTDSDWNEIGRSEPYFGVLADERFRMDRLDDEAIDAFYESGRNDIEAAVAILSRMSGRDVAVERALDLGCGVGRLTLAMARYARTTIGVDVSPDMLRIAAERAEAVGRRGVSFLTEIPDEPLDWINSLIVLQHIDPDRGTALLRRLLTQLRPGGLVSVQVTFYKDRRHMAELDRDIATYRYDGRGVQVLTTRDDTPPGSMTMFDYDLNSVMALLFDAGVAPLHVEHTDHGGCHGAYLFGVRGA